MSRKIVLLFASMAILISALFPPWNYTFSSANSRFERNAGYSFFGTPPETSGSRYGVAIDFKRLLLSWVVIGAAASIGWALTRKPQ